MSQRNLYRASCKTFCDRFLILCGIFRFSAILQTLRICLIAKKAKICSPKIEKTPHIGVLQYAPIIAGFLLVSICSIANAISIVGAGTYANPSGSNEGLSGICYVGGTQYYVVDDSGGVMQPATITLNPASGAITAASFSSAITLGGSDLEGIDYNAANNSVFVSDETGATIKEYSLVNNNYLSSVSVPSIFASYRSNYSLESLTIRGDGLEMWTCNEEALYDTSPVVDDGPLSTDSNGSVVRLQRFTRSSVHDTWVADGQWAYLSDPYDNDSGLTESERSGISDLCVLPDGTLLVLERAADVYFGARFRNRIYEVNFTGATDVSAITSLNGASYTRVTKTQKWSGYFSDTYNFEGLCLGPRLDNNALSLLMVADGDGDQDNGLYSLKITGLTTRQLTVNASPYGVAEPVGGPYRYVSGQTITNSVTSLVAEDGVYYECTGWTLTGQTPSSGSGSTMTMTITNDATLTWNWQERPNPHNTLNYVETFESYTNGFVMPGTNGWSATNFNVAVVTTNATSINALKAYSEGCGYSVTSTHDKALKVDGTVTNSFDMSDNQVIWLDKMMQANHISSFDTNLINDSHAAFYFNVDGHPMIYNRNLAAGTNDWTEILEVTADEGEWVRLTLRLDYQTEDTGNAVRYFQVRINGYPLTNAMAWTANDGSGVAGGSWFAMPSKPDRMNQLVLDGQGADVDDIVLTVDNPLLRGVEVVSLHGAVNPPVGTNGYTYGDTITLAVTNAMVTQGTTQYVCTGWNMTGHDPASGAGTNVTIILTNDLTLTWLWSTNYLPETYDDWAAGIAWGGADSSSDADADGDGFSNYKEYKAGTDPIDAHSLLQVSDVDVDTVDSVVLRWQSASNIIYAVELSTNLIDVNDWSPLISGIPATPPMNVNTVSVDESSAQQFFRVIVE